MLLTPTTRVAGLGGLGLVDFDERPRRSQQIASRYAVFVLFRLSEVVVMRTVCLSVLLGILVSTHALGQPSECDEILIQLQQDVLDRFPKEVSSIGALLSDESSALYGYERAHGDVILTGMGLTLTQFPDSTKPELLFYWPSDASPSEWLDFEGPDGPYYLTGWGYIPELYPLSPEPPTQECIDVDDWFIHEAGWHLLDGGMVATPESPLEEPDRPSELNGRVLYWHPAGWAVHLWVREGVPEIGLFNSVAPEGGLTLDGGLFWYPEDR